MEIKKAFDLLLLDKIPGEIYEKHDKFYEKYSKASNYKYVSQYTSE